MQRISIIILWILCLDHVPAISAATGEAASPNAIATDRTWQIESYAAAAGVVNHRAYGIAFEDNGDVWIAATNGLLHYDGYRWKTYRAEDGLPSTNVRAVLKSSKGDLWVGTDKGAGVFDPLTKKFDRHGSDTGLPNQNIRRIDEDPDGSLWFCCDQWPDPSIPPGGLACFKDGSWRFFNHRSGISMDYVLNYFRASNGRQFACSREGWVERVDENTWAPPREKGSESQETILRMAETPDGALWAQGGSKLLTLRNGQWVENRQTTATIATLRDGRLAAILRDTSTGKICFGIWDGKLFVPASAWFVNPFISRIYSLREAPDGALWVVGAGMILRWSPYTQPWSVYPNISRVYAVDDEGRAWVASGGKLFTINGTEARAVQGYENLVGIDRDGTAIVRRSPHPQFATYKPSESAQPQQIESNIRRLLAVSNDNSGKLWMIGTDREGRLLFSYRNGSRLATVQSNILNGRSFGSVCPANGGGLWVLAGTPHTLEYDVFHVTESEIRRGDLGANKPYCVSHIYTQTSDHDWIHGLDAVFFKSHQPGSVWKKVQISDNSVTTIEGSRSISESTLGHPPLEVGRLIALPGKVLFTFSGDKGAQSGCAILHNGRWDVRNGKFTGLYASKDRDSVFLGSLGGVHVGKLSGDYELKFVPLPEDIHQSSIVALNDRSFWAITSNGIFQYHPSTLPPSTSIKLLVSEIQAGGMLPVQFSGIRRYASKTPPSSFSYSWRFNGGEWSPFSSDFDVRLSVSSLKPGEHQIEVRCKEHGGLAAHGSAIAKFKILPLPLQHRAWFMPVSISIVCLLLFLAWISIARTRQIAKTNSALRTEIRERMKADEALRCEIAERKRAVEHQYKLEIQLREARKLEALGTLAGGIAHDFNNILTVIIPSAHLAIEECHTNQSARELLEQILRSANHARDLIQQILAFSRQQKMQLQPIAIAPLIAEAARSFTATLPPSIQPIWHVERDLPSVKGDSTQLQRLLLNLCTNARQAMTGRTGIIEIRAERLHTTQELVQQCPSLKIGDYVRLSVRDEGVGMTDEVRQRAFDPFFTTKRPGEGTGLGLSVVHGIVKEHNGAIQIDTELGKGTLFKVYLPSCASAPNPEVTVPTKNNTKANTTEPFASGDGKSLLLVDDDTIVSKVVERVLRRANYRVSCFSDPKIALDAFKKAPDSFDAVITDFAMPGINGVELSREISAVRQDIPIILITGYAGSCTPEQISSSGIRKVVGKPFDPASFATILSELLPSA